MPIKVAVVNDDEIVVRGVTAMLRHYDADVEVVELAAGKPVDRPVDIALFDTFGSGQGNSLDVDRLLKNPNVDKVAVYTWNFQPWLARDTMERGVAGYLSKSLTARQLVEAMKAIQGGRIIVSPAPAGNRLVGGDWPGREEGLTAREAEVLALITAGLSNQEIAERTQLSPNSIKSYIRNAYRKIGADSRSKAVLWGVAHGMRPDRMRAKPGR